MSGARSVLALDELEQRLYPAMALDGVPQIELAVHRVSVTAALLGDVDVTSLVEIMHDALDGALGHSNVDRDISQADIWILGEAQEHVGVVGEEGPALSG